MSLLGQLQADPDTANAFDRLRELVAQTQEGTSRSELLQRFRQAIAPHRERGEWWAVAGLLQLALELATSTEERQSLLEELARVRRDELMDESGAVNAYRELLALVPGFPTAVSALAEHEERAARWRDLSVTYAQEAETATDDVYRSSMLMRAAEMELRFAGADEDRERVIERLEQSVRLDATNVQAGHMIECCYRQAGRWEELSRVLDRLASRASDVPVRVASSVRLARVQRYRLEDSERAAVAYERLLRDAPGHAEAMQFLSELYSSEERWDELVALYERDLKTRNMNSPEVVGDMLQIAMLHYKKRGKSEDAEPWFERIRRIQPAHETVIAFFREYCKDQGEDARWIEVLQGAQYAMPDGRDKANLVGELAALAEKQADHQRAIEHYKGVLRQDPDSEMARDALKRLYTATQGFNALVELLRQQLERTPAEQYQKRLGILREVAHVYRQFLKSDASLVTVLHQIVQLDEKVDVEDVAELRELVALYDKLGRHRELLTYQLKLAELTPSADEKMSLYRAAARRWLEQFSNIQNATEAYEALLVVAPDDQEALDRLNELYRKRRTWGSLYELLEREAAKKPAGQRTGLLKEMAQLASERLHRPEDAVRLFRQILEEEPERAEVLDALEKHAERSKDWATLAYALERRVAMAPDDIARISVLQKLGQVYSEHLTDMPASIDAWKRVLALAPGHQRALRVLRDAYLQSSDYEQLSALYASQNDWEGLVEVLSNTADRLPENDAKVALSYRAAKVYEEQLRQPERAMRSYERILSVDAGDVRAARALVPLYEADEKWSRLPALYELLVGAASEPGERVALLSKLVEVTGARLLDKKAAAGHAKRAWFEAPADEQVCLQFEAATRAASAWDVYLEALNQRLLSLAELDAQARARVQPAKAEAERPAAVVDTSGKKKGKKKGKKAEGADELTESLPEVATEEAMAAAPSEHPERRALELRMARAMATELTRVDDAVAVYKSILGRLPQDLEVEGLLAQLMRSQGRPTELRWLWEHRAQHAASDPDRVARLIDWAHFEQNELHDVSQAVELYRRVLSIQPDHVEALDILSRMLLGAGQIADGVQVLERRRDLAEGTERIELELQLAELYLTSLGRPEEALRTSIRVLDAVGSEPRAISIVERTLDVDSVRRLAAEVLVRRFASAGEARREAQALSVLLETATARTERLELVGQLMTLHAERLRERSAALDVALKTLVDYPDEVALWDRAEELATASGRPTDLAECLRGVLSGSLTQPLEFALCERAAHLHEERLGDPVGATPYLERMLALEPNNERAFSRLKDILTAAERWGELEAMYERAIELTTEKSRRIDMLAEVALIAEEIMGDSQKAMRHHERILALEPLHPVALETLDQLYTRHERYAPLADLLAVRLQIASEGDVNELKRRAAFVLLDRLHEPDRAVSYVEDLLGDNPNDHDAIGLGERLLGIKSLRSRMACMLERVYEARDEIRDLVRILQLRLECLTEGDQTGISGDVEAARTQLLRRISVLRDERMHDDSGAFTVLKQLVPATPDDANARERLVEIGRRLDQLGDITAVLRVAFDAASPLELKAEIGMQLADIEETLVKDVASAEATYRRVIALDPKDATITLPAALALERIYLAGGQSERLADTLRLEVTLVGTSEERRELLRRLGQLCRDAIGDVEAAISAYRQCLTEDSMDANALAALDALYERAGRHQELAEILERRVESSTDGTERRELSVRLAKVLAEHLGDNLGAISVWRAVVDEQGPDRESLLALAELFERQKSWQELADCLERHVDLTADEAERIQLLIKLGRTRHERLSDAPGALEAYRRALTFDTHQKDTREALLGLLGESEVFVRREAARTLHPVFASEQNGPELLKVLQIEVDTEDDPAERLTLLLSAMTVAEQQLNDQNRAFAYAVQGTREALAHADLSAWLGHLDRLAVSASLPAEEVKLLREIVGDIFDGDIQLAVTLKIATMARDKLEDLTQAREYFERALELKPDERVALAALESLHERQGDVQRLLEVIGRRVEVAENDGERKTLMLRQARLLSEKLGNVPRAIEVFERIVDMDFDREAVSELERLYRAESRWDALVLLLERKLEIAGAPKADLLVTMAEVIASHLGNVPRALDELELAMQLQAGHEGAVALLERLLESCSEVDQRARMGSLLEPVYMRQGDQRKLMLALEARLTASSTPEERRELLLRIAKIHEEQSEDYLAALETMALLLHEDASDTQVRAELERLAKVAGAEKRLAEIFAAELALMVSDDAGSAELARRTAELFEAQGEAAQALLHYRRALQFSPEDPKLFGAVDAILVRQERHAERIALYRASLEYRYEAEDRLRALHMIASLEHHVGNSAAAIETLREALEVDEQDARTLDALSDLYGREQRYDDLADLLLRRAEMSVELTVAAQFRIALVELLLQQLNDSTRALDQLEEIVRVCPEHADAIRLLEELRTRKDCKERAGEILRPIYESRDDWQSVIRLNEDRFELATLPSEKVNVLRETAELYERCGHDPERAREAILFAIEADPMDLDARAEFERLSEVTRQWEELAQTYEKLLSTYSDLVARRDVLAVLAKTYDKCLDDPRHALASYWRLHEAEPSELETLEQIERLATLLSDWSQLVRALVIKADVLLGDEERAYCWRRIGEARRDMLDDLAGAIDAYERALELNPISGFTADCLLDLLESRGAPERRVELLVRRAELCEDEETDRKFELLVTAAELLESVLIDRGRAIDLLTQALSIRPSDSSVLVRLERLYEAECQWGDLLDNLRTQAEGAAEPSARATLRSKMAKILARETGGYDDALDCYRQVFVDAPEDGAAIEAVFEIGREHEDLRERAAEILVPVLTAVGKKDKLVDVLELRLVVEHDPLTRVQTLQQIADIAEQDLAAPKVALDAMLRAMTEQLDEPGHFERVERLARAVNGFAKVADVLEERARSTFDPEVVRELSLRLGNIAEVELKDPKRAVEAYRHALEQTGDRADILAALDRLYGALGDASALVDVLERRALVEESVEGIADAYYRLAKLQLEEFHQAGSALSMARSALERVGAHAGTVELLESLTERRELFDEISELLEAVYRSVGNTEKLAGIYEKKVTLADDGSERLESRRALARILEEDCRDAVGACRVLGDALSEDPTDGILVDELERLLEVTQGWAELAGKLSQAIVSHSELPADVRRDLWLRVAGWLRDRAGDPSGAETALLWAYECDRLNDDVLLQIEAIRRAPGKEAGLVEVLRLRGRSCLDEEQRVALYREAKEIAASLGDVAMVDKLLRELLGLDARNPWALGELTELRRESGDFAETLSLLLRRIDVELNEGEIRRLRHDAARVARDSLGQKEKATELFWALFHDDALDVEAANGLRALLLESGQRQELARVLERLIEVASGPEERIVLRFELARLNEELGRDSDAVDLLSAILDEDPNHAETVLALSRLFERTGQDTELVELLERQVESARERGALEVEMELLLRVAEVAERRLGDIGRATRTYRTIVERLPEHRGALDALARIYDAQGEREALAEVLSVLAASQSGSVQVSYAVRLADARLGLEDVAGAAKALELALAADESNQEIRVRLRKLFEQQNDFASVAGLLIGQSQMTSNVTEKVSLLREAATMRFSRLQDPSGAAEVLEQASVLVPDDRELLLQLCDAYNQSGRGDRAAEALERIVQSYGGRRSKELGDIHRRLGEAYLSQGAAERAKEEFEKAFRIEPGNVRVISRLAEVCLTTGDAKRAQQLYSSLIIQIPKLEPGGPITKAIIYGRRGEASLLLGERDKAKLDLERALKEDPSLDWVREKLASL